MTGVDELEVPPRRDLWDDAAVARVQRRPATATTFATTRPSAVDERRSGLVARRLEPEDHESPPGSETGSFHMISASSRLSV